MFENWAQPVTSKPWAMICVVLSTAKRLTRYKMFVHSSHWTWEKACGLR